MNFESCDLLSQILPNVDFGDENQRKRKIVSDLKVELREFFISDFIRILEKCAKIGNCISSLKPNLHIQDFANIMVQLDKLQSQDMDFLRVLPIFHNFLGTIPFWAYFNLDILSKLRFFIQKWLDSFGGCKSEKCSNLCPCASELLQRIFNRIHLNNLTMENLIYSENPCEIILQRLFSKIINRCILTLTEVGKLTPEYNVICSQSKDLFFELMYDLGLSCNLNKNQNEMTLAVGDENDRFEIIRLAKKFEFFT